MRSKATPRNHWAQISIGACALLLPPLTLGAAFYSMLATPDEGTAHPAAAPAAQGELRQDPIQPWGVGSAPQPATPAVQPAAGTPSPAQGRSSASSTGERPDLAGRSAEDVARVSDPAPPPPGNALAGSPWSSLGAEPLRPAPAETSAALLPRPLSLPGQPPQVQPPRMMATQTPGVQTPVPSETLSPDGAPVAQSKPARPSNQANRIEASAARRNAQQHRQDEFSLKNFLQQLGIVTRNTRAAER